MARTAAADHEAAVEHLTQAMKLEPTMLRRASHYNHRGEAKLALHRAADARADFQVLHALTAFTHLLTHSFTHSTLRRR